MACGVFLEKTFQQGHCNIHAADYLVIQAPARRPKYLSPADSGTANSMPVIGLIMSSLPGLAMASLERVSITIYTHLYTVDNLRSFFRLAPQVPLDEHEYDVVPLTPALNDASPSILPLNDPIV